VFWSQPHKEERFLFPSYPLIALAAATSIDAAQKLWFFLFRRSKANHYLKERLNFLIIFFIVVDPDLSDPYVFVPPGSGSISQGCWIRIQILHQAKIVRKFLIPTVL
jgi:hypothetical protein